MIKGLDFYNLVFDLIAKQENITFVNDSLISFNEEVNKVTIICEKQNYSCDKLFNSIFNPEIVRSQTNYPLLSQHFIGWFVQTKEEVFNPDRATFMDFSIDQKGNTRFMYVLPTSTTEALLEPTLFSHHLLKKEEYEADIELYLKNLGVSEYKINDKEQGNIPMTSYPFWKNNSKNIVNIGSAGGWTKASTGFTFRHTVKKSQALVAFLSKETSTPLSVTDFRKFHKKGKFWFYDLLFLDVLDKNNDLGSHVFSSLFKNGKTSLIFKFLDEETTYWEDLQIIFICPKSLFLKALFNRVFGC
jgi:lycopene beta-cyclase